MRILITGATGFLGAHFLTRLAVESMELAILVRAQSDRWRLRQVEGRYREILGDLQNLPECAGAIKDFAPDTVINLAWCGVLNRYRNELSQIDSNFSGSLALLRLAQEVGCRTWIGLGSQAEYGPHNAVISEENPTLPTTLYGMTKLITSMLSQFLCNQWNMRFVWLRLFSSYGPMDDPGWMIPYLILALLRRERPALTEGIQKWDYLYAADVAEALYLAVVNPELEGVFNLGSGEAYTIRSIVEKIRDLVDPHLPLGFGEVAYRPDQVMHLQADNRRLREKAGWSPRVSLDEGLARTVEWYRDNRKRFGI